MFSISYITIIISKVFPLTKTLAIEKVLFKAPFQSNQGFNEVDVSILMAVKESSDL